MKVWLTTQIEAQTRRALRVRAKQLGMKIGPLVDNILRQALTPPDPQPLDAKTGGD